MTSESRPAALDQPKGSKQRGRDQTDDLDFIVRFSAATTVVEARLPVTRDTYDLAQVLVEDRAAQERLRRDIDSYRTMRKAMDFETLRYRAEELGIDPYGAVRGYVALSYQEVSFTRVVSLLERVVKAGAPGQ